MQIASRRSPAGFTLIELMMVIVIIGLLAGLGTRAAWSALQAAKRAAILMEISQLDQAIADYKSKANAFPPCMGDLNPNSTSPPPAGNRFYTHITRAFPRYIVADLNGDGLRNYLDMRQAVLNNFGGAAGTYYDLNTMDEAEALVFWLSGFPTPRSGNSPQGNVLGSSKVFGFCTSPTLPFYDTTGKPMGVFASAGVLNTPDRTAPGFQFDENRLVDQDSDGWLEYIPVRPDTGTLYPPYVYFDSDLYTMQSTGVAQQPCMYYPYPAPKFGPQGTVWGVAYPYVAAVPTSSTTQLSWVNNRKFQIISAGLDNKYGITGAPVTAPGDNKLLATLPRIYPTGERYDMNGADSDNLTNFSDRQLGDAQ